jgi:hypothetical protein
MRRRVCRGRALSLVAVLGLAALGCGPVRYVRDVGQAAAAVEDARAAQAEKYAPYWWTRATEYLHKAREVAAYADYQGASRFGQIAAEAATRAAADARIAARDPSKRPPGLPPDVAPARPSEAPVAPSRDLPAPAKGGRAPAKGGPAPAKGGPAPAKGGPAPAKDGLAPAKDRP